MLEYNLLNIRKVLTKTTDFGEDYMKEITCPGTKGLVNIFDEVSIQTRILALNLALESGRGEFVKKISKGIFSKAVGLCDSVEATAQEISGLLKAFSGKSNDFDSQKAIAKLDEFAAQIVEIIFLTTQNHVEYGAEQKGRGAKTDPEKVLFDKTFEIRNMLKRFRSDLSQPAAVS